MITRVILNLNIKKLTLKNFGKIKKFESTISCEQLDQQLSGSSKVFSSSLKFTFYFFKNFENFYRFFRIFFLGFSRKRNTKNRVK